MRLIQQVLTDAVEEIGWIILYGILSLLIMQALLLSLNGYAEDRFVQESIDAAKEKGTYSVLVPPNSSLKTNEESSLHTDMLRTCFQEAFSRRGKAGGYCQIRVDYKDYQYVFLIFGRMVEKTTFTIPDGEDIVFAVSSDVANTAEDHVSINGTDYPLYRAPNNFGIKTPNRPLTPYDIKLNYSPALFVYSYDFEKTIETISALFPVQEEVYMESLLSTLILEAPEEKDSVRMLQVLSSSTNRYVSLYPADEQHNEYIAGANDLKSDSIRLMIYVIGSGLLISAMLINLYLIIRRHFRKYSVHYLFGASDTEIFLRMWLFSLLYSGAMLAGLRSGLRFLYQTQRWGILPVILTLAGVVGLFSIVVYAAFKRFKQGFSEGMWKE